MHDFQGFPIYFLPARLLLRACRLVLAHAFSIMN
jgi:hypothetical protein